MMWRINLNQLKHAILYMTTISLTTRISSDHILSTIK